MITDLSLYYSSHANIRSAVSFGAEPIRSEQGSA
jgi:hypothetical protein